MKCSHTMRTTVHAASRTLPTLALAVLVFFALGLAFSISVNGRTTAAPAEKPLLTDINVAGADQTNATITGHVRYGDNAPVAGHHVRARPLQPGGDVETFADTAGAYTLSLPGGDWTLIPDTLPSHTVSDTPMMRVQDGASYGPVDLILLTNTAVLSGTVLDRNGTPISNAQVSPFDPDTQEPLSPGAATDGNGHYTFGIASGDWWVGAQRDGYSLHGAMPVSVSPSDTVASADLTLIPQGTPLDLEVSMQEARIEGRATPNASVTITVTRPGKSSRVTTVPADGEGHFQADNQQFGFDFNLQPGDQIAAGFTGGTASLTIPDISADVDPASDRVTGQAPADAWLTGSVEGGPKPGPALKAGGADAVNGLATSPLGVRADGAGVYTMDFSGLADLQPNTSVRVTWYAAEGHRVHFQFVALTFNVDLTEDRIQGETTADTVIATLADDNGVRKTRRGTPTGSDGFTLDLLTDIAAGDTLTVTAGSATAVLSIPELSGHADHLTDRVTGRAPAGARVQVDFHGHMVDVNANADGDFAADFSGIYDIQEGDSGQLRLDTSEGYQVQATVWALDQNVNGTVRDQYGAPVPFALVDVTNPRGHWWGRADADGNFDIPVAGDLNTRVCASRHGYMIGDAQCADVDTSAKAKGSIVLYLTLGSASLGGRVVDETGAGVPLIQVNAYVYDEGDPLRDQITLVTWDYADLSGYFTLTLDAAVWVIRTDLWFDHAWTPETDWELYTLKSTALKTLSSGGVVTGVTLTLRTNDAWVTGVVADQNSNPITNAQVALRDAPIGDYGGDIASRYWLRPSVTTDISGTYTIFVPDGDWRLGAWKDEGCFAAPPPDQQFSVSAGLTATKNLYLNTCSAIIRGTVTDQYGAPVAGARIEVHNEKSDAGSTTPDPMPNAITDASGNYTQTVYAGIWTVSARGEPLYTRLESRRVILTDTQELTGVDLQLNLANAEIRGYVHVGSATGPTLSQETHINFGKQYTIPEWTDISPIGPSDLFTVGVTDGTWRFGADADGYTAQGTQTATLAAGDVITVDLVVLTNTAILSGTITDQYGQPIPNAHVVIQEPGIPWSLIPGHLGNADSVGQYNLGVAAGSWEACAHRSGYDSVCHTFTITDGEVLNLNLEMQSRYSRISGRVMELGGGPIEGAKVMLWDVYGIAPLPALASNDFEVEWPHTEADGSYQLLLDIEPGTYRVRAYKSGYAMGEAILRSERGNNYLGPIRLVPESGGWITGSANTSAGASFPVNGVDVVVRDEKGSGVLDQAGEWARTETAGSGRFAFANPFLPVTYTVAGGRRSYDMAVYTATVGAGITTNVQITLPGSGTTSYEVEWLSVNYTDTMAQGQRYPAWLYLLNKGSATWPANWPDAVTVRYAWYDTSGTWIADGHSEGGLPYDIVSADNTNVYLTDIDPDLTSGTGDYWLVLQLWQHGAPLAGAQPITLPVIITGPLTLNLTVYDFDISVAPPTQREGTPFAVRARVRNSGETDTPAIQARVWISASSGGGPWFDATYSVDAMPAGTFQEIDTDYTVLLSAGTYTVNVMADAGDIVAESDEGDNVGTFVLTVLPPTPDTIAPTGTVTINGGAETTTDVTTTLTLSATDNITGTGVRWMYIAEFATSASSPSGWTLYRETGNWIPFTTTKQWVIGEGGGAKQIQVRFADRAGNISGVASAWINYTPDCVAHVGTGEWRRYLIEASAGDALTATLTACFGQGDPDLYIWQGSNQGPPDYYSSNAGVAPDEILLNPVPDSDLYHIWVYGFEENTYTLQLTHTVGSSMKTLSLAGFAAPTDLPDKPLPDEPPVLPTSAPEYLPPVIPCRFGDFDCDGRVDIVDVQRVAGRWGLDDTAPTWDTDAQYDLDSSGGIDAVDVALVAGQWG
ncbi:MAG TPA: hypothetical protein EYH31_12120 [Anaerolineae bacterium]|nr:hypothetical protein [Anaerolineae bacterium]